VIPGRQLPGASHEATHAAALCIAGMVPECVRTDFPDDTRAGSVTVDWGDGPDRETAERVLIAIVLGGMTEGAEGWREWPLEPDCVPPGARRDAEQARTLGEYLKLDHGGWLHVRRRANQLARRRDFRRLLVRIANELERVEVLGAGDLRELMAQDWEAVAA
jgi:hypothetical protein